MNHTISKKLYLKIYNHLSYFSIHHIINIFMQTITANVDGCICCWPWVHEYPLNTKPAPFIPPFSGNL